MSEEMFEIGPITLMDEDGNEQDFEVADILEEENEVYVALIPVAQTPEDVLDGPEQLVIMKMVRNDEEEYLEPVMDDEEFDRVSEIIVQRLEEEYDFEDEEE